MEVCEKSGSPGRDWALGFDFLTPEPSERERYTELPSLA
jgi:hypothetical protein